MFTWGYPDLLVTEDPHPLVKIFSDQVLENIKKNSHLFAFKEKSLICRFRIKHAPDCTSRYPIFSDYSKATTIVTIKQIDRNMQVSIIAPSAQDLKLRAIIWNRIEAVAATDEECQTLATHVQNGFPMSSHELPPEIRQFWPIAD